jgi:hypothetical protein
MLDDAQSMRSRLLVVKTEIFKIGQVGVEMDCNTTHDNEDNAIILMQDQVPEVLKRIGLCFIQLDQINILLQDGPGSDEAQQMMDEVAKSVEECEDMIKMFQS